MGLSEKVLYADNRSLNYVHRHVLHTASYNLCVGDTEFLAQSLQGFLNVSSFKLPIGVQAIFFHDLIQQEDGSKYVEIFFQRIKLIQRISLHFFHSLSKSIVNEKVAPVLHRPHQYATEVREPFDVPRGTHHVEDVRMRHTKRVCQVFAVAL